ncbi:MAG: pyruvate kinase [Candidatus Terrybacteria bacterium RIFCSPLOWO2_02_42_20]|uniref:Pyruvate kinase n=2 Tax=Candidatus Terryibacteriota TaxID=1817920 RepID=A0A1G2PKB5_9BACT|nr:MAG: pyruvate kinase [Candidatus Terrybacteria bacterium RIFCSPHIGHO2_02_41_19]OHA54543.1 MAG: pyruvate kinase [Candidatus Terrybacteria bacterium RIFCSPLOWO2_02_42_20]
MKKTKIVATIGPPTTDVKKMEELLMAGVNVMRMNFSHGDFAEHQVKVDNARTVSGKIGIPVALLQDLGGPKIRIGDFYKESVVLEEGQTFTLTTEKIVGDEKRVYVNYVSLPMEVEVGGLIMLHDGKKKLEIINIKGNEIVCKVIIGGEIKGKRGVNLPGAKLSVSSLTKKDKDDLEFGFKNKVDFIACSFVRRPEDISELRDILDKAKSKAKIIAKIEDREGLENINKIIELVDGIMIGRGDFGIEIGVENMPMVQKEIIKKCNKAGKPVITATHMLESMIKSSVPTRAEVSDIANAILDGTDAIMLSEETALGQYPVEAVRIMAKVAERVEKEMGYVKKYFAIPGKEDNITDAVSAEAVDLAYNIGAKYIVALTYYGFAARMIARYRPVQRVIAMTPNEKVANQLLLTFGCNPVLIEKLNTLPAAIKEAKKHCLKSKLTQKGDKIVIVAGMPFGKSGMTNTIMVERM